MPEGLMEGWLVATLAMRISPLSPLTSVAGWRALWKLATNLVSDRSIHAFELLWLDVGICRYTSRAPTAQLALHDDGGDVAVDVVVVSADRPSTC